jgi:xanthine dehydrogenase small subunit
MADKLSWQPPEGMVSSIRDHIRFIFRGKPVELKGFPPTRSVLDWLREDQRATGTKEGCNEGDCGACTAVVARLENDQLIHRPINTCITLLGMLDGAELITIEDLAEGGQLHPIQQAMVEHHGSQCGFCTPGIVMSLFAMDKGHGDVTRAAVNDQLAGNLCRCTGYRPIIDAALASVGKGEDRFDRDAQARIEALRVLEDGTGAAIAAADGFFAAPGTYDELLRVYSEHPDATILAGATDVGLWITKQFRPVKKLIWLGRIEEARRIGTVDWCLSLNCGVTHEEALPHLLAISPDLGELGRRFGSKQVRSQGTVCGNIANGSPIGDWAPAFIALGAAVSLTSFDPEARKQEPVLVGDVVMPKPTGIVTRFVVLEDYFLTYGKQDRRPGEIITNIAIWLPKPDEHFRCYKISKRFDEDISALMGAFKLKVVNDRLFGARVAFGGMAAIPQRAPKTEAALAGASLRDRATWDAAIAALAEDYQPISDMRASARYRMETAQALLEKALIEIGGGAGTRLHALAAE